jgi:hypothetical protein
VGIGLVLLGVGVAFAYYPPEASPDREGQPEGPPAINADTPLLQRPPAKAELQLQGTARVAVPIALILILAGLVVAGLGVQGQLRQAREGFPERVESAALLGVAAVAVLLARVGFHPWDSARYFFNALTAVALAGSLLVLMPRLPRRIVVSVLVLFHFGGILTAVTFIAPRDQQAPWLSHQLWTRVYRPYLTFMYLTNAYHFYSPDPGPPSLLWFRIYYTDGTARWYKLPARGEDPVALHFQRFLALAESTNNPVPHAPFTQENPIYQRRYLGGLHHEPPIPLPADLGADQQFVEPNFFAKELAASYARHVARAETRPVASVRVYRITHSIILPYQMADGFSPVAETFYAPYYLGRFDRDGRLLDPEDPFLYWYLPIVYVPWNYGQPHVDYTLVCNRMPQPTDKVFNALNRHAGVPEE